MDRDPNFDERKSEPTLPVGYYLRNFETILTGSPADGGVWPSGVYSLVVAWM